MSVLLFRKFGAVFFTVCFANRKPGFGDVANALKFALHLCMFRLEDFGVCVGWNVNRRSEEDYGASERRWQQEVVPGFLEGLAATYADVEDEDGAAGFSG